MSNGAEDDPLIIGRTRKKRVTEDEDINAERASPAGRVGATYAAADTQAGINAQSAAQAAAAAAKANSTEVLDLPEGRSMAEHESMIRNMLAHRVATLPGENITYDDIVKDVLRGTDKPSTLINIQKKNARDVPSMEPIALVPPREPIAQPTLQIDPVSVAERERAEWERLRAARPDFGLPPFERRFEVQTAKRKSGPAGEDSGRERRQARREPERQDTEMKPLILTKDNEPTSTKSARTSQKRRASSDPEEARLPEKFIRFAPVITTSAPSANTAYSPLPAPPTTPAPFAAVSDNPPNSMATSVELTVANPGADKVVLPDLSKYCDEKLVFKYDKFTDLHWCALRMIEKNLAGMTAANRRKICAAFQKLTQKRQKKGSKSMNVVYQEPSLKRLNNLALRSEELLYHQNAVAFRHKERSLKATRNSFVGRSNGGYTEKQALDKNRKHDVEVGERIRARGWFGRLKGKIYKSAIRRGLASARLVTEKQAAKWKLVPAGNAPAAIQNANEMAA